MNLSELRDFLATKLGDDLVSANLVLDELTINLRREAIVPTLRLLREDEDCRFTTLVDICGVDFPERSERFELVYHLLSMTKNLRLRVKIPAGETVPVDSATPVFPVADWYEREAFDMFGILFCGHPDLRRILTDYGFEGYPLRKDFPLSGHVEVRYDDLEKRVVYEPVSLVQEYRNFDYLSPWEGMNRTLPGDEKAG